MCIDPVMCFLWLVLIPYQFRASEREREVSLELLIEMPSLECN